MLKHLPYLFLLGEILVLFFLIVSGPFIPSDPFFVFIEFFALILIGWGGYALQRSSRFSFFPHVPEKASLITTGPFEVIRHPMYSGILLFALVLIVNYMTVIRLAAFIILILDIIYKVYREEEYLEKRFGDYTHYQRKTKRLIPYVY